MKTLASLINKSDRYFIQLKHEKHGTIVCNGSWLLFGHMADKLLGKLYQMCPDSIGKEKVKIQSGRVESEIIPDFDMVMKETSVKSFEVKTVELDKERKYANCKGYKKENEETKQITVDMNYLSTFWDSGLDVCFEEPMDPLTLSQGSNLCGVLMPCRPR